MYEIIPKTKYPDSYEETGNIAKEERDRDLRPDLESYPDIENYDTILSNLVAYSANGYWYISGTL